MYTALYRAQRPEVFSEVIGQDHIVRILKNQIHTGVHIFDTFLLYMHITLL